MRELISSDVLAAVHNPLDDPLGKLPHWHRRPCVRPRRRIFTGPFLRRRIIPPPHVRMRQMRMLAIAIGAFHEADDLAEAHWFMQLLLNCLHTEMELDGIAP